MYYKKNQEKVLSNELFKNPTSEYRGAPFWSWNCKLEESVLRRQIGYLKEMGFGGVHIHSRIGLATEYLGDEFMHMVSASVDEAKKEDMLVWLYDEDRWPSGYAGGFVTKDLRFAQRVAVFAPEGVDIPELYPIDEAIANGKPYYLATYDIELNEKGELQNYRRVEKDGEVKGYRWTLYSNTTNTCADKNYTHYVDTLNKEAIEKFVEITHEKYKEVVGDEFGKTIPAIFTDEPHFSLKGTLKFADSVDEAVELPWTPKFPELFMERTGVDIFEKMPELLWDLPDGEVSRFRYLYHACITDLFEMAFFDTIGDWCENNGIMLTGHVLLEETLEGQTRSIGEAMRLYKKFHIPGIDTLGDDDVYLFNAAKQCQSVGRQQGREGMLSELYGVTNWDFDFRGHKFQGDWEAALGVTVRVPHLSWVSMAGCGKRDYPASINYQSPWYKEYKYIEDHFARVNTALTRGKANVRVGIIHPIETYWLHWGPNENTASTREQLDTMFADMCQWLLFNTIDFDYISESLIPELYKESDKGFSIGEMCYDTVIVPYVETLRSTTVKALEAFVDKGGKVIFTGKCPEYVDAVLSPEAKALYEKAVKVANNKNEIINALSDERDIEIRRKTGEKTSTLIYNMRNDEDCKWLFIAHGKRDFSKRTPVNDVNAPVPEDIIITVKGEFLPELYDTMSGEISKIRHEYKSGNTVIYYTRYTGSSMLFKLTPGNDGGYMPLEKNREGKRLVLTGKHDFDLEEKNVLLLDTAEFKLDDGEYEPEEEILRFDWDCRRKCGIPLEPGRAQPWVLEDVDSGHTLTLRFRIYSEIEIDDAYLGIEDAIKHKYTFNGKEFIPTVEGYYVDEAIKTCKLPKINKGENILTVKLNLCWRESTEYCYILGDFGVKVEGNMKTLIARSEKIGYSPLKMQTLPFYSGNITYKHEVELPDCDILVKVPFYNGAVVKVFVDGEDRGFIACDSRSLMIKEIKAGRHKIDFKLFGNRYNTFSGLHDTVIHRWWSGENIYYTRGDEFSYEYQLSDMGILSAPSITIFE